MAEVRNFIENMLHLRLIELASVRKSDAMAIYGPMDMNLPALVRDSIEATSSEYRNDILTIQLNKGGGLVDSVEKTVEILRHHYESIDFIIPGQAMSAGTVFALSADNIYMNYFSQLGPIDPQFYVDGQWIPGLGYLEKFEELNEKSRDGTLTPLEYGLVQKLDLADIHRFEQAREHSVELLEKWLSTYKFKNWTKTEGRGTEVTPTMKQMRAKQIGQDLNNTKRWHAHSRGISMQTLQDEVGLKIEDFDKITDLRKSVKNLHSFIEEYIFMEPELMLPLVRTGYYYSTQPEVDHEKD
ncbi:MAG: serine dehydrogenasease [Rhodothermaceae bacterium]|nr:serine dehydrogenasease [Rhodothermaceae bacterium]MYC03101.1 serine dehydrogenasease [Rhodothermaceae bacterium]MYI16524.1 serine dehydrogenasease [Rhodothermaceae bacterium]